MIRSSVLLVVFGLVVITSSQNIILKAPSRQVNCGCQCDNYIFNDGRGNTLGNCRSTDNTGARWCYVNSGHTCTDARRSQRRDGFGRFRQISYEACATPACNGGFLGGNNGFGNNGNNGFGNNGNNGFGNNGNNGFGNNGNNGFGNNGNNGFGNNGNNGFGNNRNNGLGTSRPTNGQISITNILRPRKTSSTASSGGVTL